MQVSSNRMSVSGFLDRRSSLVRRVASHRWMEEEDHHLCKGGRVHTSAPYPGLGSVSPSVSHVSILFFSLFVSHVVIGSAWLVSAIASTSIAPLFSPSLSLISVPFPRIPIACRSSTDGPKEEKRRVRETE